MSKSTLIKTTEKVRHSWQDLTHGSVNRQIFGAAMIVASLTILVKLLGTAKELAVAWKFGTGDHLDAFYIGLLIPEFIINIVAGSFNTALIPTYIRVREQEGITASQKLFSSATLWSVGILGITTLLIIGCAPFYLPFLASGFSPEKLDLTFKLLCVISPIVMLTGIVTIWTSVLNAGERFALGALTPIMTPLLTIMLLVGAPSWGIFGLASGLVGGAILETILLGIALRRQGMSLWPRWYGFDQHLRQVTQQYIPMIAASFLMCSTGLVDQAMAATLAPGNVAALNYGSRITALPITLITTALSTAVIPYFSKMMAKGDWVELRYTLYRSIKIVSIIAIPIAILLVVFSQNIVQILFQRGSFTASDTQLVAQIQICYALQIPLRGAGTLVGKLISTARANQILMWGSTGNLIVNIGLDYLFMNWFGVAGIALSTTCVYLFSSAFLFFWANQIIDQQTARSST
jgi:putative peptidoglycan lipid II flippase